MAALPARPMHVPAGLPIDESARKELVDVGRVNRAAVNARQDARGALSKRLGFAALASTRFDGSSRTAGLRLFVNGRQLCTIDGEYVDVRSEALGRSVVRGRVPEATHRILETPSVGFDVEVDDVAYVNGCLVLLYRNTVDDGHIAIVLDAESGVVLHGPVALDAFASTVAGLAVYGNVAIAVYHSGASALAAKYLDTTSAATIANGWTATGWSVSDFWSAVGDASHVCVASLSDRVAVAYLNTSGGTDELSVRTLNASGAVESTTVNTSSASPFGIGLSEGGDVLWVAWNEGTDVKACAFHLASLAVVTAGTGTIMSGLSGTIDGIEVAPRSAAGTAAVFVRTEDSPQRVYTRAVKTEAGLAATDGSQATIYNARLQGKPFHREGRIYAHFASNNLDELVLCDCTPDETGGSGLVTYLRPVAAPVLRGLHRVQTYEPCRTRTAAISSTKYVHGFLVQTAGVVVSPTLAEYDFASQHRWRAVELGGSTYLSGGVAMQFDGARAFEVGFLCAPGISAIDAATAGSLTFSNGGRRYVAVYEEVDADGKWHVSGVSDPVISGNVTNRVIKVRVHPLAITARGSTAGSLDTSLRVAVYATTDGGEPPYYRVGTVANDPNASYVEVTDDIPEASITGLSLLYGTGNLPATGAGQDHRAPTGLLHIASYAGMLVGSSGPTLYYSSQPVDGEGQWFSPLFAQRVDGDITGLAVLDGSLVIFTESAVWMAAGEPPSDNGAIGGIGMPRRLSCDVGCVDPASIVATGLGIFFRSARGIEILTRAQTVEPIGDPVGVTVAAYPVTAAAVLDDRNSLVRISLAESESGGAVSGAGVDVVYDLTIKAWVSTDFKRGSSANQATQDAAMVYVDGAWRYAWLATDGTVYYERDEDDASAYLDSSSFVTLTWELPPWKLGLQQEQRIYEMELLFERHSAAGLLIEVAEDYGAYDSDDDKEWTEAAILSKRQVPFRPKSRTTAVQLRVSDTAPAVLGTGRGLTFVGMSADIAPKQGATRGTTRLATELRR